MIDKARLRRISNFLGIILSHVILLLIICLAIAMVLVVLYYIGMLLGWIVGKVPRVIMAYVYVGMLLAVILFVICVMLYYAIRGTYRYLKDCWEETATMEKLKKNEEQDNGTTEG